jgi:hypothetical protein
MDKIDESILPAALKLPDIKQFRNKFMSCRRGKCDNNVAQVILTSVHVMSCPGISDLNNTSHMH